MMQRLIIAIWVIVLAAFPASAQLTQQQVNADIAAQLQSCQTGCNSAAILRNLLSIITSAIFQVPPTQVATTASFAATNAALTALPATFATSIIRGDYSTGLGSPPQLYNSSSSACSLNSGLGDGGSQVPTSDGGCWLAQFSGDIDVRIFGANGTSTDSVRIQNAINAATAVNGRRVIFPALGKAYLINTGLVLGDNAHSGTSLIGGANMYWPGPYDNVEADWTARGTWFHCTDTVNPCITVGGNGNNIDGINFWYTQTTPPSGTGGVPSGGPCTSNPCNVTHGWTPTTFPYTIAVLGDTTQFNGGNFSYIRNIQIVNATHCLDFESPTNGQSFIDMYVEHAFLGCFTIGTNFLRLDNSPHMHDIHYHVKWYTFSADVLGWMQGDSTHACHRTDWFMGYVAGLFADDIEFFEPCVGIFAYDATVTNGVGSLTFAVQSGNWTNVGFNQVCEAIVLQNATTHFDANMANVTLNVDPTTSNSTQCGGYTPVAFGLYSDNVSVRISSLDVLDVQTIAQVGGGSPGTIPPYFSADINLVQSYSQYTNSNAAFVVAAGACVDVKGVERIHSTNGSAGPIFSGAGFTSPSAGCVSSAMLTKPVTAYSAAGTPLPTCSAGLNGVTAIVSDSTAPTYRNAYTSGGTVTARVLCVNGTGWVND